MFWTRQAMFVLPPQLQHGAKLQKKDPRCLSFMCFFSIRVFNSTLIRRSPLCVFRNQENSMQGNENRESIDLREPFLLNTDFREYRVKGAVGCGFLWRLSVFCWSVWSFVQPKTSYPGSFLGFWGLEKNMFFFLHFFAKSSNDCCFVFFSGRVYDWKRQRRFKASKGLEAFQGFKATKTTNKTNLSNLSICNPRWYQQHEAEGDTCVSLSFPRFFLGIEWLFMALRLPTFTGLPCFICFRCFISSLGEKIPCWVVATQIFEKNSPLVGENSPCLLLLFFFRWVGFNHQLAWVSSLTC